MKNLDSAKIKRSEKINPKVCVIMPVYNMEKYLDTIMHCFLSQSFKEWEILCINDGSTDGSVKVIEKYNKQDPRIVLFNKKNEGYPIAINTGIELAVARDREYIAFIDPDDCISENYFQNLYTCAKQNDADIAATSEVFLIDDNGKKFGKNDMGCSDVDIALSLEERGKIILATGALWNKIYRTSFIKKYDIKFVLAKSAYCDNSFTTKAIPLANKIAIIHDAFYFYRQHQQGITKSIQADDPNIVEYYLSLKESILKFPKISQNEKIFYQNIVLKHMAPEFFTVYRKMNLRQQKALRKKVQKLCPESNFKNYFNKKSSFVKLKKWFLFEKKYYSNGRRHIYLCGLKIASYKHKKKKIEEKLLPEFLTKKMLKAFDEYQKSHKTMKLQFGCGRNSLNGWFNTDLDESEENNIFFQDMLQPFSFPDNTFDYIFSEQNIEHFNITDVFKILSECYRIMKKGAILRISTPDLEKNISIYLDKTDKSENHTHFITDRFIPELKNRGIYHKAFAFDAQLQCHGHKVLFDFPSLKLCLEAVGFKNVIYCEVGESKNSELHHLEQHGKVIGEDQNKAVSMSVECQK